MKRNPLMPGEVGHYLAGILAAIESKKPSPPESYTRVAATRWGTGYAAQMEKINESNSTGKRQRITAKN